MGLESVRPSNGPQTLENAGRTGRGDGPWGKPDESSGSESVRLSNQGRTLSKLAGVLDPTQENLRKLSTSLAGNLRMQLRQNGIDPQGEIKFEVDSQTGKVDIKGNRPDAQKVSALMASQPELERQIQGVAALSRQVVLSEQDTLPSQADQSVQSAARLSSFSASCASRLGNGSEPDDFYRIVPPRTGSFIGLSCGVESYSAMSAAADTVSLLYNGADVQVRS